MQLPDLSAGPRQYSEQTIYFAAITLLIPTRVAQDDIANLKAAMQALTERRWMPASLDVFIGAYHICSSVVKQLKTIDHLQDQDHQLDAIITDYMELWRVRLTGMVSIVSC